MNTNKKIIKATFDAWTYGPVHTKAEKAATKLYLVEDAKPTVIDNTVEYDEIRAQILELESRIKELRARLPVEVKVSTYKKPMNIGVGDFIKNLISQGDGNTAILNKVHNHYGNTNTTYACVAWYRNKVNQS